MAKATLGQRILLIALLTVSLMVPPVLFAIAGQVALASVFVYGGAIAMAATFYSMRLAIGLSFLAGGTGMIAVLLNTYPVAGGVFFGLLTGGCALAARRGLHSPVLMVPVFVSFLLVAPPEIAGASGFTAVLLTGAVLALGGLWLTGTARVLFGRSMGGAQRHEFGPRAAVAFGVIMGVLLGVAAWGVLSFARFHEGAWLLLTLIMVMQPSPKDTVTKSLQRLAGTVAGGLIAVTLIVLGLGDPYALLVAGVLLFGAFTLRFALKRPYWEFVGLLTPAIILLDTKPGDGLKIAEDRVGFTVLAVVVALLIAVGVKAIVLRKVPADESA